MVWPYIRSMHGEGVSYSLELTRRLFRSRSLRIALRVRGPDGQVTGCRMSNGQFRIVLADGLRIEIDPGFDASELRRLITALNGGDLRGIVAHQV